MGLNIKNPEAHRLAQELAELTGESMATAVTKAVRLRIEEIKRQRKIKGSLADEIMRIGREAAALMTEEERTANYDDDLYDENGLPR
jgi:antitoxin VapB